MLNHSAVLFRATHGRRMCGDTRDAGAVYAECGLGPAGSPIEEFILDYPLVLPPDSTFPLPARGVKMVEDPATGVWHVMDRIGENSYPDPAVFLEEVRALGLSRKLPPNLPFDRLTADSKILLVHDRGWINEWDQFRPCGWTCPKHEGSHATDLAEACCAGNWWENSLVPTLPPTGPPTRDRVITLPCGHAYRTRVAPQALAGHLTYSRAIVARFPITAIAVIKTPTGRHVQAMDAARRSGLPVLEDDQ